MIRIEHDFYCQVMHFKTYENDCLFMFGTIEPNENIHLYDGGFEVEKTFNDPTSRCAKALELVRGIFKKGEKSC